MKTGRGQELRSDKGLGRMVTLSAVLHVVAIAALIIGATWSKPDQPISVAYTVELVNPGALGTSLPGKKKPASTPPSVAPQKPAAPPPAPVVEEKPASPPPPPPPEVKKPEPKAEPSVVAKKEPPKPDPPIPPKEAVKLPQKDKPVEKPPVKAEPEKAKPDEKKPESKKAEPKPEAKKETAKPEKKPEPKKTDTPPASQSPEDRDKQIAAALERIKAQASSPEDRDKQIAAAMERVRSRTQQGRQDREESPFDGPGVGSGPPTLGAAPGEAGGGVVRGLEFIMYTDQVKRRVKESWIVAQERRGLSATVRFGIRPDGKVFEIELMQPSGDGSFDQSVLRAVRAADPLPPPPQNYQQEFATQKVEVTFGGDERTN